MPYVIVYDGAATSITDRRDAEGVFLSVVTAEPAAQIFAIRGDNFVNISDRLLRRFAPAYTRTTRGRSPGT